MTARVFESCSSRIYFANDEFRSAHSPRWTGGAPTLERKLREFSRNYSRNYIGFNSPFGEVNGGVP